MRHRNGIEYNPIIQNEGQDIVNLDPLYKEVKSSELLQAIYRTLH